MTAATMPGFAPVTAEGRGAQIEREDLSQGAIVRYIGERWVDTVKAKGFIHTFRTRAGGVGGRLFSIWGTGELNDLLRKITPQTILFIRYGGKHPHPELPGAEMHKWEVQTSRAKDITPELGALIRQRVNVEEALEKAIDVSRDKAAARFAERLAAALLRGEAPPPHTDDALPF